MATYILDTNVLLHDARSLYAFTDATVVIPLDVLEELDRFKKNMDEVGRNAREVIRELDRLRRGGSLPEGVPVNGGGVLRVLVDYTPRHVPHGMDLGIVDNRILLCAKFLEEQGETQVVVVSKDINARVKGDALGITTQDFEIHKIRFDQLYRGWTEVHVQPELLDSFYAQGGIHPEWPSVPNECFILRNSSTPQSAIGISVNSRIEPLRYADSHPWGIKSLNVQQRFALELLLNERIQLVTLMGGAGTGKTLLALAAGLQKVIEEHTYAKLFVSRPIMPLGRDIGYLPGNKDEKLESWMQPIYDNLKLLTGSFYDDESKLHYLFDSKVLELEAVTYIRGRSLPRQFIVIDEAQNLTPHETKTIISRAGMNTKVVLTGDPYQIDNPYLDASSNGLTYVVDRFKGQEVFGHVLLTRSERSPLAALAASLL